MELGHYKLELLGIGGTGSVQGFYASTTDRQTIEYSATQLVLSLQFNLSHAITEIITALM